MIFYKAAALPRSYNVLCFLIVHVNDCCNFAFVPRLCHKTLYDYINLFQLQHLVVWSGECSLSPAITVTKITLAQYILLFDMVTWFPIFCFVERNFVDMLEWMLT